MSDQNEKPQGEDPIVQLKGEFTRKLSNTESQLTELKKANDVLLHELKKLSQPAPKPQAKEDDIESIMYTDPRRYTEMVEERAEARIMNKLNQANQVQQKQNNVISSLTNEYPELMNTDHELTRKAVEIYSQLPDEDKTSPMAYKLAVKEAAMELGVKPRSKRSDEESYAFGGSSSQPRKKKESLDASTVDFARMMGLNVDDPKVKERLSKRAQRDWRAPKTIKE